MRQNSKHFGTTLLLIALFVVSLPLYAQPNPESGNFQLVRVAESFDRPLYVTHAGDVSNRLFVVEQAGRIHIIQDGLIQEEPFLDVSHKTDAQLGIGAKGTLSETGLLGLAFHPDYPVNGYFFIYFTDSTGDSILARYRVSQADPNLADPESELILLTLEQPSLSHQGGMLSFGPDGYLYLGLGDGGQYSEIYSQRRDILLGSIIRVDVNPTVRGGGTQFHQITPS